MYIRLLRDNIRVLSISIAVYIVVGLVIVAAGSALVADFKQRHEDIAKKTVYAVTEQISHYILEKRHRLTAFSSDHLDAIDRLLVRTESSKDLKLFESRIRDYFPESYGFSILTNAGEKIAESGDGLMGEQCDLELSRFINTGFQKLRIHSDTQQSHYDLMVRLNGERRGDVFLVVSFKLEVLKRLLFSSQLPGHDVMLLYPPDNDLIELATDPDDGSGRDTEKMSSKALERQIIRLPVRETLWFVSDAYEPGFVEDFKFSVARRGMVVYLLFSIIITLVIRTWLKAMETQRAAELHKNEFVSVVSHELRTPLTSIRGSLGLLNGGVMGELTSAGRNMVSIALQNCERLEILINDILDVQKIEAGRLDLNMRPVVVTGSVSRCISQIESYAEEYGVTFTVNDTSNGALIFADESRMDQVMTNLLSNAIKYGSERDTIEVNISSDNRNVHVQVRDHGKGIPEEFRSRMFTKFSQLDSSTTRKVSGTGLGLSIVKMIIEKHRGKIGYDSKVGEGSVFYFRLPKYRKIL